MDTKAHNQQDRNLVILLNVKQQRKKQFQILIEQLKQWKNIQLLYSKKMHEISDNLNLIIKQKHSGIYHLYSQLKQIMNVISIQSKSLASKISDDIISQLKEVSKKIPPQIKIGFQLDKYSKSSFAIKKYNMEKAHIEYLSQKKEMQQSQIHNLVVSNCVESTLQKRLKQSQKTAEAEKQFKLVQFKYKEMVDQFNKTATSYNQELKNLLFRYQQQQKYIINLINETVLKIQLHLQTQQICLTHEIKRLRDITMTFNNEECIKQFLGIYKNFTKEIWFETYDYNPHRNFITNTIKMINEKKFEEIIECSKNRETKVLIEKIFKIQGDNHNTLQGIQNQELKKIIKFFLLSFSGQSNSKLIDQFTHLINKDFINRITFVSCLQYYRIIGKFQIKSINLPNIYKMLKIFLDACVNNLDSYIAKQMMILLFTYFVTFDDKIFKDLNLSKQKLFLHQFLKSHQIWKRIDFWQSILLECIYQQKRLIIKNISNDSKQHQIQAQKNAAFNQLACITHNMILFDLPERQVKNFSNKYCKWYNLGMQKINDIQKNIEAAVQESKHVQNSEIIESILKQII